MRIAILGCDSTHTEEYTRAFLSRGISIDVYWDEDIHMARKKQKIYGVGKVYNKLKDAIINADLIMVEGRYGDSHYLPAKESLFQGKKVYIDKPATSNLKEAEELSLIADKKKTILRSFTPLILETNFYKFSIKYKECPSFMITSPAFCWSIEHEKAKNLSFYASHATDILSHLIPEMPKEIKVTENNNRLWVDVYYESKRRGMLNLIKKADEFYSVTAISDHQTNTININPLGDMYEKTTDFILNTLSNDEWREGQFNQSIISMHLIDEIKKITGAGAWRN